MHAQELKYTQEFQRIRNTPFTDVARRAGCSVAYVSRVLRGERIPRIHYFVAIAEALDVSYEALWEFLKPFYEE